MMLWTLFALVSLITTAWILAGLWAVKKVRSAPHVHGPLPGVTVLKPLCGADPGLEANLASFFAQDYPAFELIFGVQADNDPSVAVVTRLMAQHPHVAARLVVHAAQIGLNPKVANLLGMTPHAAYDVRVISDSNVRVGADYLRGMVSTLQQPGTGLVASPILAVGEKDVGAALDAVRINGWVTPGAALPTTIGKPAVIGKSLMYRDTTLQSLGGLKSLADLLAEDFVLGKMFQYAGFDVRLAPTPVVQIMSRAPVSAFWKRHLRWSMMRLRMAPFAWAIEPLANPVLGLLVGLLAGAGPLAAAWWLVMSAVRDVGAGHLLGRRGLGSAGYGPLADILALGIWLQTPFRRHVTWRGNRVRLSAGTRLYHTT